MRGLDAATRALLVERVGVLMRAGEGVDAGLEELGWRELMADDLETATAILFHQQGLAGAGSAALDGVLLEALGLGAQPPTPVIYPRPGSISAGVAGADEIVLSGLLLAPPTGQSRLLAPLAVGAGVRLFLVPFGLVSVTKGEGWMEGAVTAVAAVPRAAVQEVGTGGWEAGLAAGRRALAWELVGLCEAMLKVGTEHVSARRQFDRPIGSFQSVRHRLAEAHVRTLGARHLLEYAVADGSPPGAAIAKATAGAAVRSVSASVIQVMGAIGLTFEFGLHRLVQRGFALDELLGGCDDLFAEAGTSFATTPPRLDPLVALGGSA